MSLPVIIDPYVYVRSLTFSIEQLKIDLDNERFIDKYELMEDLAHLQKNAFIRLLQEQYFELDQKISEYCLEYCITHDDKDFLKSLVEDCGLNVRMGGRYQYRIYVEQDMALYFACIERSVKIIKYLLDLGINPNTLNGKCLKDCIRKENRVLELLLEAGGDPNIDNGYLLRKVIMENNFNAAKLLIDHGANPSIVQSNIPNVVGQNFTFVDYLLDAGFDAKQLAEIAIGGRNVTYSSGLVYSN